MMKATKSVSIFTVFFIGILLISEMPEIEAQDSKCLKEFGGGSDSDFVLCRVIAYPSLCYKECRRLKRAKGGYCITKGRSEKCFCDICSKAPYGSMK
ncbi:unnamed protein product [Microthlaspi erraticum]|uniref:Knottin scorpion toxin-like domain-containing protein n=1 Tax=Microthlaspi erraticum TaxID=1685480 RepID=A0A6D2J117_9BRAS|nr:unnamed protein product [Microthlaspi erraticum]